MRMNHSCKGLIVAASRMGAVVIAMVSSFGESSGKWRDAETISTT